jgi:hypothetical protein
LWRFNPLEQEASDPCLLTIQIGLPGVNHSFIQDAEEKNGRSQNNLLNGVMHYQKTQSYE